MWEDFMRGNWPAAATVAPDPAEFASARTATARPAPVVRQNRPAVQSNAVARPVAGKFAFRAALAAGAGLILAVVVPNSAVAGGLHTTGAHTVGAHVHAATSP
jgi:hypothetical protein